MRVMRTGPETCVQISAGLGPVRGSRKSRRLLIYRLYKYYIIFIFIVQGFFEKTIGRTNDRAGYCPASTLNKLLNFSIRDQRAHRNIHGYKSTLIYMI